MARFIVGMAGIAIAFTVAMLTMIVFQRVTSSEHGLGILGTIMYFYGTKEKEIIDWIFRV